MSVRAALVALGWAALAAVPVRGQAPAVRLTDGGARNGQAFFSPDGRWISFVSNRSGSWQVWRMPADGGDARQLTHSEGPVGWPSWTVDGDAILYYARTAAGYRIRRLVVETGNDQPLYDDGEDDFRPLMSPDGRQLLFDRAAAGHDIFARDVESGEVARLTSDPAYDSDARWSPDGRRIAFHSDRGASRYATQVFVMDADGSNVRQLTEGPAVHGYPAWSPDGAYLAYTSELDGNRDIWIVALEGGDPIRITHHPGFDGDPVWTPRGRQLLFSTDRFGGRELALVTVADRIGSAARRPGGRPAVGTDPGARGWK